MPNLTYLNTALHKPRFYQLTVRMSEVNSYWVGLAANGINREILRSELKCIKNCIKKSLNCPILNKIHITLKSLPILVSVLSRFDDVTSLFELVSAVLTRLQCEWALTRDSEGSVYIIATSGTFLNLFHDRHLYTYTQPVSAAYVYLLLDRWRDGVPDWLI